MRVLPESLYSSKQARYIDQRAGDSGLDGDALMRRAGQCAFSVLQQRWPRAQRVVVVCGSGNNGGDGYVVAELAAQAGYSVTVVQLGEARSETAKGALAAAQRAGITPSAYQGELPVGAEVIVDGLLGIGLDRAPTGLMAAAIDEINALPCPVLALDIPSGLSADSGAAPGVIVQAAVTVTFIALKLGLFTGRGPDCCGEVVLDTLAVPPEIYQDEKPIARRIGSALVAGFLPRRQPSAHKGMVGHLLVVGGNTGMTGAARLAGEAALRCGTGLVSVACPPSSVTAIGASRPELMVRGVADAAALRPLLAGKSALVAGPGLGQDDWGRGMLATILDAQTDVILDADALNLLAAAPQLLTGAVLTPHPGEAGRLLDCNSAAVQSNRPHAASEIAGRYGCTCVLKGAGSIVQTDDGMTFVCDRGNPGMASGGMGDVLAGVIGSLAAQGLPGRTAAIAGVWLHSAAADLAALAGGQAGLIAGDLMPYLRGLVDCPEQANESSHRGA